MGIPNVGLCFTSSAAFIDYLDDIKFGAWRPRFVTMHHTGAPDLKTWQGWQTRAKPVTDEQWLKNLAEYYAKPAHDARGRQIKGAWSAGPHFFFTPKHFCVLSPPDKRGIHAASFNSVSWGVECVGDFDRSPLEQPLRDWYVEGLAALHIVLGLPPAPFQKGVRGLHFHRDDPQTSKTCPGKTIAKDQLVREVAAKILAMTDGAHVEEHVEEAVSPVRRGKVNTDNLNVRATASAKAPIVRTLRVGEEIEIEGEAKNGDTLWFAVDGGYAAARYITVKP